MTKSPARKIHLGSLDHSPVGDLRVAVSGQGLVAVEWSESQPRLAAYLARFGADVETNQPAIQPYADEILEYLQGTRKKFTFKIDWGTLQPFQLQALKAVFAIPYGQTRTYAEIAAQIGHPNASRAVGRANATNPMPLVIPCHRVIGTDGKLHGYGGGSGLPTKAWLLKLEGGGQY
jgi:methylated-DNA-[protein]-cysteine S-methyltransferase